MGKRIDMLPRPRSEQDLPRPRSPVALAAVIAVEGAALAILAGLDGSPGWRVARVLVMIAVAALAVWFTRRGGRAARGATVLMLGIAGTAAGVGVASGHLAKAGPDTAPRAWGTQVIGFLNAALHPVA